MMALPVQRGRSARTNLAPAALRPDGFLAPGSLLDTDSLLDNVIPLIVRHFAFAFGQVEE